MELCIKKGHAIRNFLGGVSPNSGRNDKVEFNKEGNWREGPSLPTRLSSQTSHDLDGDLYVLGGLLSDTGILGQSNRVFRLQKGSQLWEELPKMTKTRSHHVSVALPNSRIMLIGDPYANTSVEIYGKNSTKLISGLVIFAQRLSFTIFFFLRPFITYHISYLHIICLRRDVCLKL